MNEIKNLLPYWTYNAIFKFIRQFASGCLYFFQNSVDNFDMLNMLNFWFDVQAYSLLLS